MQITTRPSEIRAIVSSRDVLTESTLADLITWLERIWGYAMNLQSLQIVLREFSAERDWDQFHSPKNLSMALSVEVAELVEHFQWLTEAESNTLRPETAEQVAEEIADIQIYLVRPADKLGVDIDAAVAAKLEVNRLKYPADQVRGSASKDTSYERDPKT